MSRGEPRSGHDRHVHVLGVSFDPHRIIYATIILMVTLTAAGDIDIDLIQGQGIGDLTAVVLFPLLALSLAHSFSDALDIQIRTGKRLVRADRLALLRDALQYLAVGVPVVIFGLIMSVLGGSMATVIEISNNVYALSLVFWGAYAARAAGLRKWGQVRFGLVYGLLGMTIVIVEYFIVH